MSIFSFSFKVEEDSEALLIYYVGILFVHLILYSLQFSFRLKRQNWLDHLTSVIWYRRCWFHCQILELHDIVYIYVYTYSNVFVLYRILMDVLLKDQQIQRWTIITYVHYAYLGCLEHTILKRQGYSTGRRTLKTHVIKHWPFLAEY